MEGVVLRDQDDSHSCVTIFTEGLGEVSNKMDVVEEAQLGVQTRSGEVDQIDGGDEERKEEVGVSMDILDEERKEEVEVSIDILDEERNEEVGVSMDILDEERKEACISFIE